MTAANAKIRHSYSETVVIAQQQVGLWPNPNPTPITDCHHRNRQSRIAYILSMTVIYLSSQGVGNSAQA